jgi:hypothetical protein
MTISSEVTYGAGSPKMAQDLSAAEDRAMTDVGRDAMPDEDLPSFSATTGPGITAPPEWMSSAVGNLQERPLHPVDAGQPVATHLA